jgi:predicted N-formylglutamate amidohydrolase
MGLTDEQLASHIAWDLGAAALARKLSERLDATLLLTNYSRLVIDCNRTPGTADSIPEVTAQIKVPGNVDISELDKQRRRRSLFDPYQRAIADVLSRRTNEASQLLSIHSFTPSLNGDDRPWAIGVCYKNSESWAQKLLSGVRARVSEEIGDNQPYAVTDEGDYTILVQGESRGIPSVMLELRHDKLDDNAAIAQWSNIIAGCCLYST